jgi:hypothetical protein
VIDHLHAEAQRAAPRDRLPDAAHAQDAQRRAMHVAAGEHVVGPARPFAPAQVMFALGHAARGGHHQREAEVGRGLGQHVGRVGGQHAARIAGVDVDVVVAHRHVAHRAQLRVRDQHLGIDALAAGDEGAGLALQVLDEFGLAVDAVGRVVLDFEVHAQPVSTMSEHGAGHEHGAGRRLTWTLLGSRGRRLGRGAVL